MSDFDARVALLPWGNVIEDFLAPIGLSLEQFCEEMTGGWLFGYVEALRLAGIDVALVCVSSTAVRSERRRHRPSGATVSVLPAPRAYAIARRRLRDPYGWSRRDAVGDARGAALAAGIVARELAGYLALPLRAVGKEVRRLGCAAVLCQEYESPRFDASVMLGRALDVPVFASFQGGDFKVAALERVTRAFALRQAAGLVIGPALEIERVAARYALPPSKLAPIPNPLDVSRWVADDRAEARSELGFAPTARVVAWHGRVDLHRKGLDVLVAAWRRLAAISPASDLRLLLVGTGADAAALRDRIGGDERVTWVDEYLLDRDRMRRLLSSADVYAFPSRSEGLPVAPLEAMALGLPVVATELPGTRQIFPEGDSSGGILVPQEDAHALGSELARLLADEGLREQLGGRARARVEDAYSPGAVGTQLREFFLRRGMRTRTGRCD